LLGAPVDLDALDRDVHVLAAMQNGNHEHAREADPSASDPVANQGLALEHLAVALDQKGQKAGEKQNNKNDNRG